MKNINKMLLVVAGLTTSQSSLYFEEQPINSKELEGLLSPLNEKVEQKKKVEDDSLADLLKMLGANENGQLTIPESEEGSNSSKTQMLMQMVGVLMAAMPVIQIILSLKGNGNNQIAYSSSQKPLAPNVISALRSLDSFCSRVSMYSEAKGLDRAAKIEKLKSLVTSAIVNDGDTLNQALAYLKLMEEISKNKDINYVAKELMKEGGYLSDKVFNEEMLNYIKDWTSEDTQKNINEFNEKLYSKGSFARTAEGTYVSNVATPFKWTWSKTKKAAGYVSNSNLVNKVAGHTTSYGINEDDIKNHQMVKVLNLLKEKVRRDTHEWAHYLANK